MRPLNNLDIQIWRINEKKWCLVLELVDNIYIYSAKPSRQSEFDLHVENGESGYCENLTERSVSKLFTTGG